MLPVTHLRTPLQSAVARCIVSAALALAVAGVQGTASARVRPKPQKRSKAAQRAASKSSSSGAQENPEKTLTIVGIRHWSSTDVTHVAVDLDGPAAYKFGHLIEPERLFFDLQNVEVAPEVRAKRFTEQDGFLTNVRVAKTDSGAMRVALDLDRPVEYSVSVVPDPYRLEVTFRRKPDKAAASKNSDNAATPPPLSSTDESQKLAPSANSPGVQLTAIASRPQDSVAQQAFESAREAKPDGNGERSLIRALGLKIGKIVIDAGHGGDDHCLLRPCLRLTDAPYCRASCGRGMPSTCFRPSVERW